MVSAETLKDQNGMSQAQRQKQLIESDAFNGFEGKLSPPMIALIYKQLKVANAIEE
jgi:hypothetical protein